MILRHERRSHWRNPGSVFLQDGTKNGTMAATFVFTIATDREVRLMGQGCECLEHVPGLRLVHFRSIARRESPPAGRIVYAATVRGAAHQPCAGGQIGQPDVEPVSGCVTRLPDASGWPAHGAQPHALASRLGCSQTDDSNRHRFAPVRPPDNLLRFVVSLWLATFDVPMPYIKDPVEEQLEIPRTDVLTNPPNQNRHFGRVRLHAVDKTQTER